MPSIKVLILTTTFLPTVGGLQYELKWFLDNLDRRLRDRKGIHVHLIYPNQESEPCARFDNISTHDLRLVDLRKQAVASAVVRLGRLLKKIDPDVVHCHAVLPDGLWVSLARQLSRTRTKVIVTSHGDDIAWLPEISYGRRNSYRSRLLANHVAKRLSTHVLPSRALMDFALDAGTRRSSIAVIPNGIPVGDDYDFEQDTSHPTSPDDHDAAPSHRRDGLNILSFSKADTVKNLDAFVEAFALAKRNIGDSKLMLSCHGHPARRIAQLVERKGLREHVLFIGEVTGQAKRSYLLACDVYCITSHFENFPISILEAMKFQAAVLATRVGGIPEIVEDGTNGLLASPTDVPGIASALVRLYRDPGLRSRLIENASQTVKKHSISQVVEEYLNLYERVKNDANIR